MLFSKNQENLFLKVLGLFSIVRGYNILILILAQYLTARYVFSPNSNFEQIIFDLNLFYLVFATALSTSSEHSWKSIQVAKSIQMLEKCYVI